MAIIKNAELHYAKLDPKRPSKRFNPENPTWEIQIRTTDKAVKKEWEALGLSVKAIVPDEGAPYFRANLSKKSLNKEGQPNQPVKVVDAKLREVDPSSVGNGSVGNLRIFQREYVKKTGGQGISTTLMAVQLVSHIVYIPTMGEDFDELEEETSVVAPPANPMHDIPDDDF